MTWPCVSAGPQDLQRLADAFDQAWIELNQSQPLDPQERSAAREHLSYLIIHVWQTDQSLELAAHALQLFRQGAREHV